MARRSDSELCDLLGLTNQPREAVKVAREWLLECFTDAGDVESITLLNAVGVVQGIESHYDGGFAQFLADNLLTKPAPTWAPADVARGDAFVSRRVAESIDIDTLEATPENVDNHRALVAQSRAEYCESQVPLAATQDLREEWLRAASFWWSRA